MRRAFPDGAWFVDLTEARDHGPVTCEVQDLEMLAFLVAASLGLHDGGGAPQVKQLTGYLAARQALLVLDNCEHLLPGCAVLAQRLLRECPRLRVLATSREPLAVTGEVLFPVPPMSSPDGGGLGVADLRRYEAVALFAARARAVLPEFELTAGNGAAVAEICRRLDGLPLAVELAAARVRVLTPVEILDRLADRFALLVGPGGRGGPERQQTLRACVDWSFELCAKPERVLWARLAVFVAGFELDAVEGVCADEHLPAGDLLNVVTGLVDKSVLVRDQVADSVGEWARYRMLETVRDYGEEQLRGADEYDMMRRRHCDWYRGIVEQAAAEWISDRQAYWHARLTREHPNLRVAVENSPAEDALRLTLAVPGPYWFNRGMLGELRRWLEPALAQVTEPTLVRARALLRTGHQAMIQDDEAGARLLAEGEALARQLDTTTEVAFASYVRGERALYRGDLPTTIALLESSLAMLPAGPGPVPEQRLGQLLTLGIAYGMAGHADRAEECVREVLAVTEPHGERHYRSFAWWVRAASAWSRGSVDETSAALRESLRIKRVKGVHDQYGTARCIEGLGWVAAARKQHRRAATLLGAADVRWTDAGTPVATLGHLYVHHERCEQRARQSLGDPAFTDAFARGRALSYDDAIAYALGERLQPATSARAEQALLTRRELQVADLLAQGLSNREIAAALVVSQRTAESHVGRILIKLGFTSRAQVAAWAARQGTAS